MMCVKPVLAVLQTGNKRLCYLANKAARPVEMYEARMKELGKDITVDWYDTGHAGSFTNIELGIANEEKMLRFASQVIQGK